MPTSQVKSVADVFKRWTSGDEMLRIAADELRTWTEEVAALGIPHFGEAAGKLVQFREFLRRHFDDEDTMSDQLEAQYGETSPEVAAVRRQADRDHDDLLGQLDSLIARLSETDPTFESWQAATDELGRFFDHLRSHEDREATSISALMPDENGDSR